MRVLALDVGDRRIGVAVSDPTQTLARSLLVLRRTTEASTLSRLTDLVREQEAVLVLVGYPLSLSGNVGPQAAKIERFADRLAHLLEVPVELWDERYSSSHAERILRERGLGVRRRRQRLDATAAAVFLQDFLDNRGRFEVQASECGEEHYTEEAP
jgi:putative Holliday junction resolvase